MPNCHVPISGVIYRRMTDMRLTSDDSNGIDLTKKYLQSHFTYQRNGETGISWVLR